MSDLKASSDVLAAHLAGEAVLLNLADKRYYRLNETAAFIWAEIEKGSPRAVIISRILETYDINETDAAKQLDEVVSDLISRNLLATGNPEPK